MAYTQEQVVAVLKKAVELYLKDLESGFEDGAYPDAVSIIDDFNLYWTEAGEKELEAAAVIPQAYQELLDWLKEQGKEERDLFRWWATADYDSIRDMTLGETVEWLTEDVKRYDRELIMDMWVGMDEDQRTQYKQFMLEAWNIG